VENLSPNLSPTLERGFEFSPFQLKKFFLFPPKSRGGLGRGGKGVGGLGLGLVFPHEVKSQE